MFKLKEEPAKAGELKLISFERQIDFLQSITLSIVTARDFREMTKNSLRAICENTEFVVGHAWLRSSFRHKKMHFIAEYYADRNYEAFSRRARTKEFRIGEGLPGMVWQENKYKWIEDIEYLEKFSPVGKAGEAEIKTAFALPIPIGLKKVLGVIILYLDKKSKEDSRYVKLISTVTMQLGLLLQLKMAEENIKKQYDYLKIKYEKKERDLNQIIENLEQFGYMASHDLQSPLRAIHSLTEMIYSEYYSKIDPEGQEIIQRIKRTAGKMDRMVKDLLEFSRAERPKAPRENIDVIELIEKIKREIKLYGKAAIKTKGAFPLINYYYTSIYQLFMNLMRNGVEHNDKTLPIIEIGAYQEEENWIFYVKDNGPGIPKKLHHKIFLPFESHDPNTKDSTGLGLAIVKKIVEQMGGEIHVDSKTGAGAVFWFSVPLELISRQD